MCVFFGGPQLFQEAAKRINRSPTQLSFPQSDSTLDMLGVILEGSVYREYGKNLIPSYLSPALLRQPKGKRGFACAYVCVRAV